MNSSSGKAAQHTNRHCLCAQSVQNKLAYLCRRDIFVSTEVLHMQASQKLKISGLWVGPKWQIIARSPRDKCFIYNYLLCWHNYLLCWHNYLLCWHSSSVKMELPLTRTPDNCVCRGTVRSFWVIKEQRQFAAWTFIIQRHAVHVYNACFEFPVWPSCQTMRHYFKELDFGCRLSL